MTAFTIALTSSTRPLLAWTAVHGLTDLAQPNLASAYLLALLCPLPDAAVTALFCAASVGHLALDVGYAGSVVLHLAVCALARTHGNSAAFNAFLVYFAFVHTPLHYLRESRHGRGEVASLAALVGVALSCLRTSLTFVLTNEMQRVVIAHVLVVYATHKNSTRASHLSRLNLLGKIAPHRGFLFLPGPARALLGCFHVLNKLPMDELRLFMHLHKLLVAPHCGLEQAVPNYLIYEIVPSNCQLRLKLLP